MKQNPEKSFGGERNPAKPYTFISVVVPVYNDPEGIETTLKSLVKLDYPVDKHEIILVNNNSGDETPGVAARFRQRYPDIIKLLQENTRGPSAARNRGIRNARGDIICFIDSDMWVKKDWLSKINGCFRSESVDYLGYKVEIVGDGDNIVSEFNKLTGFPAKRYMEECHFAVTAALAVRKEIFAEVGMFDERLFPSEDREFGNRAYAKGCRLGYSEDIVVYHPALSGLKQLWRKYFRIGKSKYKLGYYWPDRYGTGRYKLSNPKFYLRPNFFKLRKLLFDHLPSEKKKMQFALLGSFSRTAQYCGYAFQCLTSKSRRTGCGIDDGESDARLGKLWEEK